MEPASDTPNSAAAEHTQPGGSAPLLIQADRPSQNAQNCDSHLLAFMAERDLPCPNCGYNLRGLHGNVCPECSQELKLMVGLVEPKLGAWLAGVLGLAVGAGFYLMISGYILLDWLLRRRGGGPVGKLMAGIILPGVVLGAFLISLLLNRHRFREAGQPVRIALAIACWLLSLLSLLWFRSVDK